MQAHAIAGRILTAVLICAAVLTVVLWGQWFYIALVWALLYPAALFIGYVVGFILAATNPVQPDIETFELEVISKSAKILGHYKDAPIFEWLKVSDGKKEYYLEFIQTYRPEDGGAALVRPGIQLILQPGLLYGEPEQKQADADLIA